MCREVFAYEGLCISVERINSLCKILREYGNIAVGGTVSNPDGSTKSLRPLSRERCLAIAGRRQKQDHTRFALIE